MPHENIPKLSKTQMRCLKAAAERTVTVAFHYGHYQKGDFHRRTVKSLCDKGLIERIPQPIVNLYGVTLAGRTAYDQLFGPGKPWIDLS